MCSLRLGLLATTTAVAAWKNYHKLLTIAGRRAAAAFGASPGDRVGSALHVELLGQPEHAVDPTRGGSMLGAPLQLGFGISAAELATLVGGEGKGPPPPPPGPVAIERIFNMVCDMICGNATKTW